MNVKKLAMSIKVYVLKKNKKSKDYSCVLLTQTVSNYFLSVYQLHYAIRTETAYLRLVTAAMWPQNNRWGSEGGLILPLNPSRPVLALWPWRCSQNVLKLGTETEAEPWISRQTLRETILTDSQSQGSEKPKTECSGLSWSGL